MNQKLKKAIKDAWKAIYNNLPIFAGVILLIGLVNSLLPSSAYTFLFSRSIILDSVVGASLGSIMAGNPMTSYILAGELLSSGVALIAATSFIVAWVTVGVVQLPAESMMLGKKFAVLRNIMSFVFSILVAILTVIIMGVI